MIKRNEYVLGDVIEREEFFDGRYGAPGEKRQKKKKATPEQMRYINAYNKAKRARHRLLLYFDEGDWLVTLTYKKEERPPDIKTVKKHLKKFTDKLREEYRKRGKELFWIRNIENNTRNNFHIHLVVKDIPDANVIKILNRLWTHGMISSPKPLYKTGGFRKLAEYITKDEHTTKEMLGEILDHKVTEACYSTSRNMPLKPPDIKKLKRWPKEPREKKGYYIDKESYFEGINPVTGCKYRRYTMYRIIPHRRI